MLQCMRNAWVKTSLTQRNAASSSHPLNSLTTLRLYLQYPLMARRWTYCQGLEHLATRWYEPQLYGTGHLAFLQIDPRLSLSYTAHIRHSFNYTVIRSYTAQDLLPFPKMIQDSTWPPPPISTKCSRSYEYDTFMNSSMNYAAGEVNNKINVSENQLLTETALPHRVAESITWLLPNICCIIASRHRSSGSLPLDIHGI